MQTFQQILPRSARRPRPQLQPDLRPDGGDVPDEGVHHVGGVVRGGRHPEDLLAPGHRREVDGLHVVAEAADQVVGDLGADRRVAHLKNEEQIESRLLK